MGPRNLVSMQRSCLTGWCEGKKKKKKERDMMWTPPNNMKFAGSIIYLSKGALQAKGNDGTQFFEEQ